MEFGTVSCNATNRDQLAAYQHCRNCKFWFKFLYVFVNNNKFLNLAFSFPRVLYTVYVVTKSLSEGTDRRKNSGCHLSYFLRYIAFKRNHQTHHGFRKRFSDHSCAADAYLRTSWRRRYYDHCRESDLNSETSVSKFEFYIPQRHSRTASFSIHFDAKTVIILLCFTNPFTKLFEKTMADANILRRRTRTRPRSGDDYRPSEDTNGRPSSDHGIEFIKGISASSSVGVVSHQTDSTEQSFDGETGRSSSQTVPLEVVVINDDEEAIPSIRGTIVKEDVERRLQQFEMLITTYRNRLKSAEHLNDSLHKYLRQTQGYAENLLSERKELIDIIEDMEKEDTQRVDQELMLKFIMCSSLFLYLFGGSHQFLAASVALQLVVTVVNIVV